jgi:hypothetical protein
MEGQKTSHTQKVLCIFDELTEFWHIQASGTAIAF